MNKARRVQWLVAPLLACLALWAAQAIHAQSRFRPSRERGIWTVPGSALRDSPQRDIYPGNKFTFARLRYRDRYGRGRGGYGRSWRGSWATDWPESDLNFSMRLAELTTIDVTRDKNGKINESTIVTVDLMSDRIFDYPFIYTLEVGGMWLSEEEAQRLRSYLLRGGFLHVDDFWGEREWDNWETEIRKVFPDEKKFPMREIPLDHELFHCVFEIKEVPQIPSIHHWLRYRVTYERLDAKEPKLLGIFDEKGRLMVVITFNSDLGDGWEREAESEEYFREFSAKKAYPLGINIVVYAMTH